MFDNLTSRMTGALQQIRGKARISEDNIKDTLREVRMALLEADVALPVVKDFIERVRERAIGKEVAQSLSPGQEFVRIVQSELENIMGEYCEELNLAAQPPAVILVAGLQGAGKTTSVAKLARWLKERKNKRVMVASVDVYRPAAIQQLETLAKEVKVDFFPSHAGENPIDIARGALSFARKKYSEVLIIDTAGRLHIDEDMMREIQELHQCINPVETLFVVDAMTGQDAANTAKAFNDALPLTGVILTKTDGDSRGGAALSVRHITGKPIKFIGVGEKTEALEPFHPDRIASRILDMGDVLSLIEEVERKIDVKKAERLVRKVKKGSKFDLNDFYDQLEQMRNMGGVSNLMDKLPGMGQMSSMVEQQVNDKSLSQMGAIICSMTPQEKRYPDVINNSRKRRITMGSGTQIQDLNRLLKQHKQMQRMMKKFSKKGGMANMMRGLSGMMSQGGNFPRT